MTDPTYLDLVNHPELPRTYAAYAGFDGLILHAQQRRANGAIVDADLRGPGLLECDVAYHGLRRIMVAEDAADPIPVYPVGHFVFAGFDVGRFDIAYGGYSLIVHYGIGREGVMPLFNRHFLFDRRTDADALLKMWMSDATADKETFMDGETLRPHAVFRQLSRLQG